MPTTIDLLPQSKETLLTSSTDRLRVLNLSKLLVDEAIFALEDFFIYRNAYAFDGHVGETSCQIRAYQIHLLIKNIQTQDFLWVGEISKLKQLAIKLALVISNYQSNKHYREEYKTIVYFFQERNIFCKISELTIYLAQLRLLSRFKLFDSTGDISINYKLMCESLKISKHIARRIIHIYQIKISKLSTQFIYSLLIKNKYTATTVFDDFLKIDEDGRFTLPCYWVMTVLYKDMIKQKMPILIICERFVKNKHIDNVLLRFKVSETKPFSYEYSKLKNYNENGLYFVLKGSSHHENINTMFSRKEYADTFIREGIEKILLGNMAIHPQYSGKDLFKYKTTPFLNLCDELCSNRKDKKEILKLLVDLHNEQQKMVKYAKNVGLAKCNQRLFYIRHILCDTIGNQTSLVKTLNKELGHFETALQTDSYATA